MSIRTICSLPEEQRADTGEKDKRSGTAAAVQQQKHKRGICERLYGLGSAGSQRSDETQPGGEIFCLLTVRCRPEYLRT